ncbi:MAG: hypothetical protein ACKVS9_20220 [Phycisphaerae bacterium]
MAALALLGSVTANGQVFHYNLSDDFSLANNPAGSWSYDVAGAAIACTIAPNAVRSGWGCYPTQDVSVTRFTGPGEAGWHDAQMGDVVIHVASSCCGYPSPVEIAWTVPIPGLLTVQGGAWNAVFAPDRDAGWQLALNAQTLASRSSVFGLFRTDAAAAMGNNLAPGASLIDIPVNVGNRLVFTTSRTGASAFGHFMGVDIDLELHCTIVAAELPSKIICPGGTTSFQAESIGALAADYAWEFAIGGGSFAAVLEGANADFTAIGADDALLQITPDADYAGPPLAFRCVLSNVCGQTVAGPATLTVSRADINCDGSVGLTDLALLLSSFGTCTGDASYLAAADIDLDECVSLSDLAILLTNFGS